MVWPSVNTSVDLMNWLGKPQVFFLLASQVAAAGLPAGIILRARGDPAAVPDRRAGKKGRWGAWGVPRRKGCPRLNTLRASAAPRTGVERGEGPGGRDSRFRVVLAAHTASHTTRLLSR